MRTFFFSFCRIRYISAFTRSAFRSEYQAKNKTPTLKKSSESDFVTHRSESSSEIRPESERLRVGSQNTVCFLCRKEVKGDFITCRNCSCCLHSPLAENSECQIKLMIDSKNETTCPKCSCRFTVLTTASSTEESVTNGYLVCIVCDQALDRDERSESYCSDECLENLLKQLESCYHCDDNVTVKKMGKRGTIIFGKEAPKLANLKLWLKANPTYIPLLPPRWDVRSSSENFMKDDKIALKQHVNECGIQETNKKKRSEDTVMISVPSSPATVQNRNSIKRHLSDILMNRARLATDVLMGSDDIKRLASAIENEIYRHCKGFNAEYKQKLKFLSSNLKNMKHNSFFRRVIRGELTPLALAQMGEEKSGGKDVSGAVHYAKETKNCSLSSTDSACDQYGLLDTTAKHKSHLFDLNCRVCTGLAKDLRPAEEKLSRSHQISQKQEESSSPDDKSTDRASCDSKSDHTRDVHSETCVHRTDALNLTSDSVSLAPVVAHHSSSFSACSESVDAKRPTPKRVTVVKPLCDHATTPIELKSGDFFCDTVWSGTLDMPSYLTFDTTIEPVSGPAGLLKGALCPKLTIIGRIPSVIVYNYVTQVQRWAGHYLIVVRFAEPFIVEDRNRYHDLYNNMVLKDKYCVIETKGLPVVKDFYILPLAAEDTPHPSLLPFTGPGLHDTGRNVILGILIRHISAPAIYDDVRLLSSASGDTRTVSSLPCTSKDGGQQKTDVKFHPLRIRSSMDHISLGRRPSDSVAGIPCLKSPSGSSKSSTASSAGTSGADSVINATMSSLAKTLNDWVPANPPPPVPKPPINSRHDGIDTRLKDKQKNRTKRSVSVESHSEEAIPFPTSMNEWMALMSSMMFSMLQTTPPCWPPTSSASAATPPAPFVVRPPVPRLPVPVRNPNPNTPLPVMPAPSPYYIPVVPSIRPPMSVPVAVPPFLPRAVRPSTTFPVGPNLQNNILEEGEIRDEDESDTAHNIAKRSRLAYDEPASRSTRSVDVVRPPAAVFPKIVQPPQQQPPTLPALPPNFPMLRMRPPPFFDFTRPPPPIPRARFQEPVNFARFRLPNVPVTASFGPTGVRPPPNIAKYGEHR
ncbi:unnamed protein product [Soboliphyme baturini]|uniref:TFIIS central domain-containing protein n=1 Tax=Soboliphyme baturini TaxID=241478 RepID=A0A3P8AIK2_9BILA|nr:unnamed protein product [Soboliphyme baturini]